MTIAYGIIFAVSLLLPTAYFTFARKKQKNVWLLLEYSCVCIVNLGYFLLSLSKTVGFALTANKIAYFGQIFLSVCMLMIISQICGFTYKKWVTGVIFGAAVLMFAIVFTTGHLDWYYKSVKLIYVDGAAKLVKEYGALHPLYTVYVIGMFVAMLTVIGISLMRNEGTSKKLAGLMLVIVLCNIGIWLVEKFVPWDFEFLSLSYLMSEIVFFFVYWMLQDYVRVSDLPVAKEEKPSVIFVNSAEKKDKIEALVARLPEGTALSARQLEVLGKILEGKSRKEIAIDLCLSENTVKMHTSSLYKVLGVTSREEIYLMFQS